MERIRPALFLGFAISSIGGPLALASLFAPGALGSATSSAGLATLLGVALFAFPLAVWYRFSERIASAGGLSAFVEAATGRRAAIVQGWIWAISYFLYLPYTVTYVVYDVLPIVFPGIVPYRSALELALPAAIVLAVLARLAAVLAVILVGAAVQLAAMLALGSLQIAHGGAPTASFLPHDGGVALGKGAAGISLFFVCASLPLFLGGEVRGGTRTVRAGLLTAFLVVSPLLVYAVFPFSQASPAVRNAAIPGYEIALQDSGRPLAVAVGLAAAGSVVVLIVAEYLALGRLLHALLRLPVRSTLLAIAPPFLAADALSLIDPGAFYDQLLRPSLLALFVSQAIVFAVYPSLRRRAGRLARVDLLVATVSVALMLYGLYTVAVGQFGLGG